MKVSKNFSFWIVGLICLVASVFNAIANNVWISGAMAFLSVVALLIYLSYRQRDE